MNRIPEHSARDVLFATSNPSARVFFFVVAPFCSCPASLVSRKFFAVGPGCAKCFFLLRSVGRRDLCVFFFALAPCRRPTGLLLPLPFPGAGAKKKNTLGGAFFLLWPRAGAQRGFSFACFSPGPQQKKKHPRWCFFLLWPRAGAQRGFSFPCLSPGPQQKKETPWVVFFFLLRPRADAHSLTAGLGGDASPSPGWCFFFLLRPRPDRGGVFFLLWPRPDAHSLTVGWGDFGKARVMFVFCCGPAGSF